ncbi:MAG TPA: phospholipid carrier-dependent glycosyltransferase [Patescibacteria group bacterium]
MQKWYSKIILALIVALAFMIRIFMITQAPQGAFIDEAHFGYLAYSLNETGADEHGTPYPLLFKGFGDQKLPMGAYLMMPVVKLFGLSNATIRYPSILAGTLLVLGMYWLTRELGFKEKWGLLAAFITAISPWSFFLSRFGFESNLALLWFVWGLVFLMKVPHSKNWYWPVLAGLSLGLTWYSYIAYRPVTVLLAIVWLGYWWLMRAKNKSLSNLPRQTAYFALPFLLLISVWFHPAISKANTARLEQVGILEDPGIVLLIDENRAFCDWRFPRQLCYAIWNKPTVIGRMLFSRYLHTFSPEFLATRGEAVEEFLTVEHYGQFFHLLYPFFIIGLAFLIFSSQKEIAPSTKVLLIAGLLLAALPGLIVGEPQKVRISALFPFIVMVMVLGVRALSQWLVPFRLQTLVIVVVVAGSLAQSAMYLIDYYGVHTVKAEFSYQSYMPELMAYVDEQVNENTLINIVPFFSDPLMFYAYYTHMNPAAYQEQAVLGELEVSGFQHTVEIDGLWAKKMTPEEFSCQGSKKSKEKLLYITDQTLAGYSLIKEIKATNGVHTYVKIYEVPVQACE